MFMRKGSHAIFNIQLHIVFVTKYRHKIINEAMLASIRNTLTRVCEKNKCMLKEFNGESDHVHLLLDLHPDNNLSSLIGSMKSASSRIVRSEFKEIIDKYYWKDKFWSDSYCAVSGGGAPLEIVKQYIQSQDKPKS
ncbi:transposase [Scytonema hofmannii PCC 7110]|uniref:Transposase n=1 Tax=Scytonema hofmannii PCC 7110 TaxID=128403 RepID=A0A139X2M1_9CYAN|nr:transposase [Scytonema hofmannii PCC 7110]